jgi:hypothetical protein
VRATVRAIRRSLGAAPGKKMPATADMVRRLLYGYDEAIPAA